MFGERYRVKRGGQMYRGVRGVWAWSVVVLASLGAGCSKKEEQRAPREGHSSAATERTASVEAGEKLFTEKCSSCHTVGEGDRVGPDLHGVTSRRERKWLHAWIKDPATMAKTDPAGKELFAKWNRTPMPVLGLQDAQIEQLIDFLAWKSARVQPRQTGTEPFEPLRGESFERAKTIYFNRCAGCHGTLRAGATGPKLTPDRTRKIGTKGIEAILTHGTPGGMPAWGDAGILSKEEIHLMARFVQMDPPAPPSLSFEQIKESWKLLVPPGERPHEAPKGVDWKNFFGVVLRDAGKVAIIDGTSKEKVAIIDTGFAVHILRSSASGRYFVAVGRDGRVSMIDLWSRPPRLVAQVQGCFDARSVDGSKFEGYEDKYLIEGCYWPPQYVVYDGQTLEPLVRVDVPMEAYDTKERLQEVRVAAIVASHQAPVWLVALKEAGYVAVVDYSKDGFPIDKLIPAERFLHDGGWDHSGRYFMIAANMRNKICVVDVAKQSLVRCFETGTKPHPGRGANWRDPKFGWVNATAHIGQGVLTIYGADPQGSPENAWKVLRTVKLQSAGSLFVKTHPASPWVLVDFPLAQDPKISRQVCAYAKASGRIERCWAVADHGRVVHFEFDRAGKEVWVSVWDKRGEVVVYDAETLAEKARIQGDWLVTPTGKFNVFNTAGDVY